MMETRNTTEELLAGLVRSVQRFVKGCTEADALAVVVSACAKWGTSGEHAPTVTGAVSAETGYSPAAVLMALDVVGSFINGPTGCWLLVQAGRRAAERLQALGLPMSPDLEH